LYSLQLFTASDFKGAPKPTGSSFNAGFFSPELVARALAEASGAPPSVLSSSFRLDCTGIVPFRCNCRLKDWLPRRRLYSAEF
jgi:hypothetical protein